MTLSRSEDTRSLRPGQYAPIHWRVPSTPAVHLYAVVCCPSCGRCMAIAARVHQVETDGRLTPSLVCPFDCSFHTFVRFAGWVPGEADPIAGEVR